MNKKCIFIKIIDLFWYKKMKIHILIMEFISSNAIGDEGAAKLGEGF
jgi:hypothetical protein